jgi:hypothetical protein
LGHPVVLKLFVESWLYPLTSSFGRLFHAEASRLEKDLFKVKVKMCLQRKLFPNSCGKEFRAVAGSANCFIFQQSLSPGQTIVNVLTMVKRGQTLHDESLQARVCMRVFSTHMPRSNENKSCMRVDEIINSHPHLTGALASRELKQSCFFTMIKHACQAENVVILDSFISLNCFPLKSSEDSLLLIQYYYRRKPKLRRMF